MDVSASDFPEIRWHGHWIWVPEDRVEPGMALFPDPKDRHQETHGLFRTTFALATVPTRVPARLTADSRYTLFANGREVSRGPARSQPRRMQYDLVDLAPFLRVGDNVIAVYVKFYGRANSFYMPAVANSILGKSGRPSGPRPFRPVMRPALSLRNGNGWSTSWAQGFWPDWVFWCGAG